MKSKAVCLSESTLPNWKELKDAHGEYGFVFRKKDIIRLKGAPAIYLPQSVINLMKVRGEELPETIWPYLNKLLVPNSTLKRKHDFLHEREWRVPCDIPLDKIRPYAVTFSPNRPGLRDEELILEAAREFHEISDFRDIPEE
ncbi:hypothetical protein ACYFX5_19325 [Bremerella sp. T1]|uniref:hypothetical protein n=1 Tax=Bremerella sp. TYQ1 TaxID=3119568 RepID=UPI001CCB515E|nr:hypothetical protein [Bremerella volcania]UBM35198.1 hypothetical protein LA756_21275 [Bremerella volcania]